MQSKHGALESTILTTLWDLEKNGIYTNSVKDVFEILQTKDGQKRAYTTIKTVMDRLYEKKILLRYSQGRKFYYRTVYSINETISNILNETAKRYLDNDLEKLSLILESMKSEKTLVGV